MTREKSYSLVYKKICLKNLDILEEKLLIVDFLQHEINMDSKSINIA